MLVLSRRELESVYIGEGDDSIEVYVAEIKKGRVRLGITAPGEMRISRSGGNVPKPPINTRLHSGPCPRCGGPLVAGMCSVCDMLWELQGE